MEEQQQVIPEEAEEKPSLWSEYWRGTVVFSLLLGVIVLFIGDLRDATLTVGCSLFIFLALYPVLGIAWNLFTGNLAMFILLCIFMSLSPLMVLIFGGFMVAFAKLFQVRKCMKFYLPALLLAAIAACIVNPDFMPEVEKKQAPRKVAKATPTEKAAKKKPPAPKTPAVPRKASAAQDVLLAFSNLMEVHFYSEMAFTDDIPGLLRMYGGTIPPIRMAAIRSAYADGDLRVRIHGESYEAAIRWADNEWWVYAYPKPAHTTAFVMVKSPNNVPPFNAIRAAPATAKAPAPTATATRTRPRSEPQPGMIYSDQPATRKTRTGRTPPQPAPAPTRYTGRPRTAEDWQGARASLEIGGVMQGRGGRVAVINNDVYKKGDTVSVEYRGRVYAFTVADIQRHDVVLEKVEE